MLPSRLKSWLVRGERTVRCGICGRNASRPYREFGRCLKARAVGVEAMLHACDHCTHKQFLPELDPEQLAQVYGDHLFSSESERESYAVHYRERLPPYRDFAERVLQLAEELGLPRSARVHEFGCGAGITVKYLRDLGFKATGSDWSPTAIRFAKEMGNEHVFIEDMNTPGTLAGEKIDILLALHVIEHVADPPGTLSRFASLLGPRSIIVLMTNHGDGIVNREHGMLFDSWFYFPQHIHYFSAPSFKALAESAGLKVLRLGTTRREFVQVEAALGPLAPGQTREERLREMTLGFQNQELEMVLALESSPLEPACIDLPPKAPRDSSPPADWDSHEDYFRAESPWRRRIVDPVTYAPLQDMVHSSVHDYWYWDVAFVGDHWLAHYDREPLPMLAFEAPKNGVYRIEVTSGIRHDREPPCQFIVTRPDAPPEAFTVDHVTSSRRSYAVRMRRGDLFGVAVRAMRSPNVQKAICLISVRR